MPRMYFTVDIENATAWCNNCEYVSLKSLCIKKSSVELVVTGGDEVIYKTNVAQVLIEKLLTVNILNNSMKETAKRINKIFSFCINKKMWCIQVLRCFFYKLLLL